MGLIKKAIQEGEIIVPYEPLIPTTGGKSLNVDSTVGENLFDNAFKKNCTHFRNKFTFAIWAKTDDSGARHFEARVAGNAGRFELGGITNQTTLRVQLRNSANTLQKDWRFTIATVWNHIVVVVNKNKGEQLKVFLNGVKVTSFTKTVDLSLSSRKNISITNVFASEMQAFYSLAVWDRALREQEIPAIYNGGNEVFNLRVNSNGYLSRKYLRHWFIPEADQSSDKAMGIDYGKAYKDSMNLMDNASLVTRADDLILDTPSGR